MRPLKQTEYSTELVPVVSADCEKKINDIIANRIAAEASQKPLEIRYDLLDAQGLYQFWNAHDSDGIRNHLMQRFESRPREVISFLAAVLGVTQEQSTAEDLTMIEEKDWYETINRMLPAENVMEALARLFPDRGALLTPGRKITTQERIAKWFIQRYEELPIKTDSER